MLLSLILKNVRARPVRSLLTALGVGVGIAAIIAVMTTATSLKEELRAAVTMIGYDIAVVQGELPSLGTSLIDESRIDDIQQYDKVERASGFLLANVLVSETSALNLFGVRLEDMDMYLSDKQIISGIHIRGPGEIVLGKLSSTFIDTILGETVEFNPEQEFEVVGIYETGNSYLDSGGIVTLSDAQTITHREGKVTMIAINLISGVDADEVAQQIEADMPDLKVTRPARILETISSVRMVDIFAWVFSLIAMIIGGIGVINIMSISVSERTREIGILMAVGWGRAKILRMVLGESLILSLGGFAIGSLLGVGAIYAITFVPPNVRGFISLSLSGGPFLIALAISVVLGLVGGAYPAYWASRLSPVEALSHE